jgi:hypothetical protein
MIYDSVVREEAEEWELDDEDEHQQQYGASMRQAFNETKGDRLFIPLSSK